MPIVRVRRTRARACAARQRRGFTLLETLMALIIIGVGILAFVEAQGTFFESNRWSSQAATGMFLGNEVREFLRNRTRHDPVTGLEIQGGTVVGWGREPNEQPVSGEVFEPVTLDDIDDFDSVVFGPTDGLTSDWVQLTPGPISAGGELIPEIDALGNSVLGTSGGPSSALASGPGLVASGLSPRGEQRFWVRAMPNWRQRVRVSKVDPFDLATARAANYTRAAGQNPPSSTLPVLGVDEFPLRVTVTVEFRDVGETQWQRVVETSWIQPR